MGIARIADHRCSADAVSKGKGLSLPVVADPRSGGIRKSRTSRWRALSLIILHLLIVAHIVQWLVMGRTLSPVEPSEAMYTLNHGYINAGAIFFALALLATLIFGRFVCGWGCHIVAYQDLCAWLLKKASIKPKPFRSRLLVFAPLALALYMFVWPTVYRIVVGAERPTWTNHVMVADFWATFPGPVIAILTFAVCGFAIVYFLGAKGFCTYGCPYGGFFGVVDQFAAGRILVTDACEHCGHCTAVCTSNVRVHEEVALYKMVVDPGCMKCMDCVSVCPNDALHFGFAMPPIGAKPIAPRKPVAYDFTTGEELAMVVIGLGALLTYRGLYDQIPLLFAMGLAAITAYLVMKGVRLVRESNVRLQNVALRQGGRLTRAGWVFVGGMAVWLVFTAHSAVVQAETFRGRLAVVRLGLGDDIWLPGDQWAGRGDPAKVSLRDGAIATYERAERLGLMGNPRVLQDLVRLYLAGNNAGAAESAMRRLLSRLGGTAEAHRGLASVLRKAGRNDEAVAAYREALKVDPSHRVSRDELIALLASMGRVDEAAAECRAAMALSPAEEAWPLALGRMMMAAKRGDEVIPALEDAARRMPQAARVRTMLGTLLVQASQRPPGDAAALSRGEATLREALALDGSLPDAHYQLGYALLLESGNGRRAALDEGIRHLQRSVELDAAFAPAHYNLGVATFMSGRPADAEPHIREAIRLAPNDAQAWGFLAVVLDELGNASAASEAKAKAAQLAGQATKTPSQ